MSNDQNWDEHWGAQDTIERWKDIKKAYPELIKLLLDSTNKESRCIELGCGSGIYALEMIAHGRQCIASDISQNALELTKLKGKEIYNVEVPTRIIDACNINYPADSFDLVFSDGVIEHLDIPKVMHEMKKILKPGGWMVAKVPSNLPLYKIVYYILSPVENRPYEAWFSKKKWQELACAADYRNVSVLKCGSVFEGFTNRFPKLAKILKPLFKTGKIYFLIKAQK